ncbi:hypothetical protein Mgra_00008935 [Meloidogyne graminicola]|uniref:Uncharacterized protein n=1 Tax=Meloidogyne graminicola TaxID=189291 RepID=A0A8S9ZEC6_9BILA|nr:hypothetical protein Mgra_00008935 [Meloidogyne graminicola]
MLTTEEREDRQAKIDENMKKTRVEYRKLFNTPFRRYQFRMEAFKIALYVSFPVAAVWIFNSPFFEEKTRKWREENYGLNSEENRRTHEKFKNFYDEMKENKRREDHEKFLKEQMAFEEAKRIQK